MKFLLIFVTACLMFIPYVLYAQNHQINSDVPTSEGLVDCNKLIGQTELSFKKRRHGTEALAGTERQLTKVLRHCPNVSSQSKIKEKLAVVREERAEQSFRISVLYLEEFQKKGQAQSAKGGCFRLIQISEKYPDYSKIDRVFSLLKGDICSVLISR